MTTYHDEEWGVPVHDDGKLFEFIVLESAQAGLSWNTILQRRENYRAAFAGFDPQKVAIFDHTHVARLLLDPGIIRNRLKIQATISNAQAFLRTAEEFGTFDSYIWRFVDGVPVQNAWPDRSSVPAITPQAEALSRDLRKRGFKFMGPTICYAHMQASGMVNDHTMDCFRWSELQ